ncbi:bacterioferritin [Parelusimicrobium proximum]|uniref:ferritin-like domain-containing protein n=1 Tax=Parelusimicrobium proximum TaxID=3228953 RepID=UPI003D184CD5
MGTTERKLVEKSGIDVDKLIEMLNKALADEWLAAYQYWVGAKIVVGPMRPNVQEEMEEHYKEELEHADKLADRIVQLGGTPVVDPKEWFKLSGCGYDVPKDPSVFKLLEQNIRSEQCAMTTYKAIMDFIKGKDVATFDVIKHIYLDEVDHEQDLQDLQDDLEAGFKKK